MSWLLSLVLLMAIHSAEGTECNGALRYSSSACLAPNFVSNQSKNGAMALSIVSPNNRHGGFTRVVLEQAPPVLGYLTVFHVPESFYEKHGDVKIYKHSRSSSPPLCDSSEASLCGRVGYTKVRPKDSIDAILISRSAREAGVRPVLSITIGNSYNKTTTP